METNLPKKNSDNTRFKNGNNLSSRRNDTGRKLLCIPSSCSFCSLGFECAVFLICGFFIAIAGNIATLIVFNETVSQVANPISKNITSYPNETTDFIEGIPHGKHQRQTTVNTSTEELTTENILSKTKFTHLNILEVRK